MAKMSLEKEYKAPIEKVWEAITTPEKIKQFWSPPGMKTTDVTIDKLEKGGIFIYAMKNDQGFGQRVKCEYIEVDKPHKLTFNETIVDEDNNPVPPSHYGMPGDEIKTHYTELMLEEKNGVTKLTMNIDYGDDKTNEFASMGWKGMLENLASVLE